MQDNIFVLVLFIFSKKEKNIEFSKEKRDFIAFRYKQFGRLSRIIENFLI